MKTNNQALNGNRSNLEKHVLKHLAEKECFESYEEYLDYPERYLEKFIQENVERFCADIKPHKMYQDHLETLKRQIITASTEVTTKVAEKKGSASMWLTDMCENVGKLIVIDRDELHSIKEEHIEDWQFLKHMMATSLEEMIKDEKEIDVNSLRKTCTSILFQQLQGCWAQCPFCKAICTNTIPNHDGEHSVTFHRCVALAGWHSRGTDHFSINFCTTAVSSDHQFIPRWNENESIPYKTYRKAGDPYNKWNITPDGSVQRYWKWFICQFQEQLENKHEFKFVGDGAIPNEWKTYTKESALAELE
ncbi:interferon-induced very large GTPase 1-like [Anguilla anguilla]|uniref:interferon-induced very large GTPase 1-like n=1 Tax=Anguilla anguilla TaxID=7936 RepID=UPI0015B0CA0A|nr:interferon-induced very large GTPase 1-like [Anguilla anguilla]